MKYYFSGTYVSDSGVIRSGVITKYVHATSV